MPEAGTFEPGTDGLQQLLARLGGGVLYTFVLRPKKITFQISLQDVWASVESV